MKFSGQDERGNSNSQCSSSSPIHLSVAMVLIVITHMSEICSGKKRKATCRLGFRKGNGQRGFGITGAHHHKSWDNDDFRTCVLNAIVWTAKMEVPSKGVKSSSNPTEKQKEKRVEYPPHMIPKKHFLPARLLHQKQKIIQPKSKRKSKGWKNLFLTITDGGNGYSCDWADWANPVLIDDKGNKTRLTSLKNGNQPKRIGDRLGLTETLVDNLSGLTEKR